jgi:Pyruvate/2-oxoacid:ferredoxin oxidoreductase delta subunit
MIEVNQNLCKGCSVCGEVCPRQIPIALIDKQDKIIAITIEKNHN